MDQDNMRLYKREEAIVFRKTREAYGGLSNMAAGFPLCINGIPIPTAEALYQACRYPHKPDVQALIIRQTSPMTAKMKSKKYYIDTRPSWDTMRVAVMKWCLKVKLAQNWDKFEELLLSTGNKPIVEESLKDPFWGSVPQKDETLLGMNVLGRLLMDLREMLNNSDRSFLMCVEPVPVELFLLCGKPIGVIEAPNNKRYFGSYTISKVNVDNAEVTIQLRERDNVKNSSSEDNNIRTIQTNLTFA